MSEALRPGSIDAPVSAPPGEAPPVEAPPAGTATPDSGERAVDTSPGEVASEAAADVPEPEPEPEIAATGFTPAAPHSDALDGSQTSPSTAEVEATAVPTISFGFNLGKIPGQGEDSDPIVRDGRELGLVAVFDGMGGAGGTVYQTPDGPRTGAYLASRIARDVVERRMLELLDPEWNLDGPAAAEELRAAVEQALVARLEELKAPASGLRSRLLRALPTTMALAALQRREPTGDVWACHLLWSGDSRVYVLEPSTGVHQVTKDDIRDHGDAMANLREDSVVSNAMSADTAFVVHHRMVELTAPFIVVAATDGCFGYVRSPMHFERMLLTTLQDATTTKAWSAALQQQISAVTGDDAAMALLGIGADHDGFREVFRVRTATLDEQFVDPIDALASGVEHAERELDAARRRQAAGIAELWGAYKPEYERYLTDAEPAAEVDP